MTTLNHMRERKGITLLEVLAAIFIMGVGLMALLTLFPLGALNMARSVRDDRAGHNLEGIGAAMHAYHDKAGRFPGSMADVLREAGYPKNGHKDGYKVVPLRLEANAATLANQPGEPGVHGMYTAVLYVSRAAGKRTTQITFEPTPGAIEGRRYLREKLLDATAQATASLLDLLTPDEQAAAHKQIPAYLAQTPPSAGFAALKGPDGLVSLSSLRAWLISHPNQDVQQVLASYWDRIARDMQLEAYGQNWLELPGVSSVSGGSPVISFEALVQLTALYVNNAAFETELLGYAQSAAQAASQGLLGQKEAALDAYVAAVRRGIGVHLSPSQGSTLLHLAQSL